MKVNEIERLLARYYDGETSDTEEKELKRFFTEEDVPAHLLAEKEIFMQLAAHPALRRTVPIQALSGTARYLRHPRRSIRTGPEGTYHAFQQPE